MFTRNFILLFNMIACFFPCVQCKRCTLVDFNDTKGREADYVDVKKGGGLHNCKQICLEINSCTATELRVDRCFITHVPVILIRSARSVLAIKVCSGSTSAPRRSRGSKMQYPVTPMSTVEFPTSGSTNSVLPLRLESAADLIRADNSPDVQMLIILSSLSAAIACTWIIGMSFLLSSDSPQTTETQTANEQQRAQSFSTDSGSTS